MKMTKITKVTVVCEAITILFIIGMVVFMNMSRTRWLEECESPYVETNPNASEWYRVYSDGHREHISLPVTFSDAEPDETIAIETIIGPNITDKDFVSTRAISQNMRVYVGGELRRETEQKFEFFKWPAVVSRYVTAEVSTADIGKTLRIEGTTPFKGPRQFGPVVYGEMLAIILGYAGDQAVSLIAGMLLIFTGAICLLMGIILRIISHNRVRSDLYGLTLILIALWDLTLCDFSDYLFTNLIPIRFVPAIAMSIIPMLLVLYIDSFQSRRHHKEYFCFFVIAALSLPICILLHTLDIFLMPYNLGVALTLLGVLMVLFIKNTITDIKAGVMKDYWLAFISICILGLSGLLQSIISFGPGGRINAAFAIGGIISMPFIVADGFGFVFKLESDKRKALLTAEIKSQFLATMSHEIRTPINAVLGMNEIILRDSSEENIRNYAADIDGAGKLLLSIVNDILDFSKLESGKMDIVMADYNVGELLRGCLQMVEKRAKDKNLSMDVSVDPQVPAVLSGDRVRIQQIVTNLLTNAVKYTPEGKVGVAVSAQTENGTAKLKIAVSDTGTGIKSENIANLFNNFERLDLCKNANIEGTGLGLAITDKLIKLMDGEINVESEYGKGSVFTVIIPQKIVGNGILGEFDYDGSNHRKANASKDLFRADGVKLLIVDDVVLNLKVATAMLKNTGMDVQTAGSGAECLEKVSKEKYDVIFLDHMMPEMDGIETKQRMAAMENNPNADTPIIMLTANVSADAKEKYRNNGFADYLSKPFSIADIEGVLLTYLPAGKIVK